MAQKIGNEDWKLTRLIILTLGRLFAALKKWVGNINRKSEGKYTPAFIGWSSAFLSVLILVIILFIPPFVGMSDNGSFARTANPVGIYHKEDTRENLYFNYYVREYLSLAPEKSIKTVVSSLQPLIYIAKAIDDIFSRDTIFDLRFLALLYGILYIPAIALLIKQAAYRARTFSESVVVGAAGVLVFADVSYIAYFSSFYPEPMMFVTLLYCIGSAFALHRGEHNIVYLAIYTISGIVLTTVENQCAIAGLFLGILGVRFMFTRKNIFLRLAWGSSAMLLFLSMLISVYFIPSTYTQASKYHAMTRGVLLQSSDPDKTLKEFGIDSSYSILTDTSTFDEYPIINPYNKALEKDFYNRYSTTEIAFYYLKHPRALTAMLDISVKAAFNVRNGYTGNYEKSAGLPKLAKSLFWSMWSNFKMNSAPKTVGFIAVLLIGIVLLFNRKALEKSGNIHTKNFSLLEVMTVIFLMAISQAIITIVNSGDAELQQHLFLFGTSVDILSYFCFSELLHKLRIF